MSLPCWLVGYMSCARSFTLARLIGLSQGLKAGRRSHKATGSQNKKLVAEQCLQDPNAMLEIPLAILVNRQPGSGAVCRTLNQTLNQNPAGSANPECSGFSGPNSLNL